MIPLILRTTNQLAKYVPKEDNKSLEALSKSGPGVAKIVKDITNHLNQNFLKKVPYSRG